MSPDLNIPSQLNSNDFMIFFTDKIDNIRNTIANVDSTVSSTLASFIAPKEKLQCFTTIRQDANIVFQDGAEYGSRVASSEETLQFFVCFICFFVVLSVRCF